MNDNDDDNDVLSGDDHGHVTLIFIIQSFIGMRANGYDCNWQTAKYIENTKD